VTEKFGPRVRFVSVLLKEPSLSQNIDRVVVLY